MTLSFDTPNYFFERETDNYHLVVVGNSREDSVATFQSKRSGRIIPHFSAKLSIGDHQKQLDLWVEYLRQAEVMEGDVLDKHLANFAPLTIIDPSQIRQLNAFQCAVDKNNSGHSYATLASVLDTDHLRESEPRLEIIDKAISVVTSYSVSHESDNVIHAKDSLIKKLESLRDKESSRKRINYTSMLNDIGDDINQLNMLNSGQLDFDQERPLRDVLTAYHVMGSRQEGRLQVSLSHGTELPRLEYHHPYHQAVKKMVLGKSPMIDDKLLESSGLFGGDLSADRDMLLYKSIHRLNGPITGETTPDFYRYMSSSAALSLDMLTRVDGPEEKRNLFQILQAYEFNSGAVRSYLHDYDLAESSINKSKLKSPISQNLWNDLCKSVSSNMGKQIYFEKDKFGKKESMLLPRNRSELNKITITGMPGEIKTSHGETLRISPYTREEMISVVDGKMRIQYFDKALLHNTKLLFSARESAKYARVEYFNSRGDKVFSGDLDIREFSSNEKINSDNISLFALMDMPPGIINRPEHFFAIEAVFRNRTLSSSLAEGALKLRDKQIKKSDQYNGPWKSMINRIDQQIDKHPDEIPTSAPGSYINAERILTSSKALENYSRGSYIEDMNNILNSVMNAIKASYMVDPQSRYDDLDVLLEGDREHNHIVLVYGEEFNLSQDTNETMHEDMFYNAKLDMSDKAHKKYGSVRSQASPDVDLSWDPAFQDIVLEVPGQPPISIRNLSSYRDISYEGDIMNHCVGGYGQRCISGEYMVCSVMQDGQHKATIGFDVHGENEVEFDQLQGYGNGAIDPDLETVIMEQFVEPIQEGEVNGEEIYIDTPDTYSNRLHDSQLLSLQLDFEIASEEKMKICREYMMELAPKEKIVAAVNEVLDRQSSYYWDWMDDNDMPGFFDYELSEIEKNRQKLYTDFGLEMNSKLEI